MPRRRCAGRLPIDEVGGRWRGETKRASPSASAWYGALASSEPHTVPNRRPPGSARGASRPAPRRGRQRTAAPRNTGRRRRRRRRTAGRSRSPRQSIAAPAPRDARPTACPRRDRCRRPALPSRRQPPPAGRRCRRRNRDRGRLALAADGPRRARARLMAGTRTAPSGFRKPRRASGRSRQHLPTLDSSARSSDGPHGTAVRDRHRPRACGP